MTKEDIVVATFKENVIYEMPEGYELLRTAGNNYIIVESQWQPKVGEAYYEVRVERYKPIRRICVSGETFAERSVYKTLKDAKSVCKHRNAKTKLLLERLNED